MQKNSHSLVGPALIVTAATLWALDGIIRRSLYSLPPITIVFFEHLIGLLFLLPFFLPELKKEKFTKKELGVIATVSLSSSLLGTLWFTTALLKVNFISFSVVFLLQKLQPLFAITTAHFFLKEKITSKYFGWAALALSAAYFVTFPNGIVNFATGTGTIVAALYALAAAAAWGSGTTLSKMALNEKSPTIVTGARFAFTTVFGFIAVFLMGQSASLFQPTLSQLLRFVMIALSTGMVGLFIYYKGLEKTQVKVSTILELTFPFLAILIDTVLYKTFLAPTQYVAALVLLFAMYQIALQQQAEAKEE